MPQCFILCRITSKLWIQTQELDFHSARLSRAEWRAASTYGVRLWRCVWLRVWLLIYAVTKITKGRKHLGLKRFWDLKQSERVNMITATMMVIKGQKNNKTMACGEYQCQAILFFKWTCHSGFGRMVNCALIVRFKSREKNARWCWWRNVDVLRAQAGAGNAAWSKIASLLVPPTLHNPVPLSAGGWQRHRPWVRNGNRCLDVTLQEVEDRVPPHPWQEIVWRLAQCLGREIWHSKRRKQKQQNNEEAAVWWRVCVYLRVGHGVVPPEDPGGGNVSH